MLFGKITDEKSMSDSHNTVLDCNQWSSSLPTGLTPIGQWVEAAIFSKRNTMPIKPALESAPLEF